MRKGAWTYMDTDFLLVAMLMTGPMNEERYWFLTELYLREYFAGSA
jgi:hypothetical protein